MSDHGPEADAPLADLLEAATRYLQDIGIEPTVIGGIGIMHEPNGRHLNHLLTVKFEARLLPGRDREL